MKPTLLVDPRVVEAIKRISGALSDRFLQLMQEECKIRQFSQAESLTVSQLAICFLVNEMSGAATVCGFNQDEYVDDIRRALLWDSMEAHRSDVRSVILNKMRKDKLQIVKGKK